MVRMAVLAVLLSASAAQAQEQMRVERTCSKYPELCDEPRDDAARAEHERADREQAERQQVQHAREPVGGGAPPTPTGSKYWGGTGEGDAAPAGGGATRGSSYPTAPRIPTGGVRGRPAPKVAGSLAGAVIGGSAGAAIGGSARRLQPARIYLKAAQIPMPGVGAYGVLALRGRPTEATRERLMRLCQSYVTYLPRWDSLPGSVATSDRMATIMPVDDPDAARVKADDCGYVLDHYDLFGGLSAIQDATRQGAKVSGPGPFLIGWSPASARGQPDKVVLVYDMSSYVSQDSFDHAFIWWQQKIIEDPGLWRNGWSADRIRISIRDFFDRYGEATLAAIKFYSGGK